MPLNRFAIHDESDDESHPLVIQQKKKKTRQKCLKEN